MADPISLPASEGAVRIARAALIQQDEKIQPNLTNEGVPRGNAFIFQYCAGTN